MAPAPERPKMLIIDRDPSVRGLLALLLKDAYEFDQALSGILAVQLLRRHRYDYILASLDMPSRSGFSGTTVLQKIRAVPGCERTPLVAIASPGAPVRAADLAARGAVLIERPADRMFDPGALQEALAQAETLRAASAA